MEFRLASQSVYSTVFSFFLCIFGSLIASSVGVVGHFLTLQHVRKNNMFPQHPAVLQEPASTPWCSCFFLRHEAVFIQQKKFVTLQVPSSAPQWMKNTQLCFYWYPTGDSGQCGGGVGRTLCAKPGQWTPYYYDDTDGRKGGCKMSWGLNPPRLWEVATQYQPETPSLWF